MQAQALRRRRTLCAAAVAVALGTFGVAELRTGGPPGSGEAVAQQGPQPPGPFPDVVPEGDTYTVAGERDGTSEFPVVAYEQVRPKQPGVMDFEHYHTSAEIEWWLKTWAYEHPEIVDLYEVGRSFSGQPIWQLTITNKATGEHTDKPAAFFEGGRHSGEILSTESAFWLAWKLITDYGTDRSIRRLVDEKTFYIRPQNNPDGSDLYRLTAQANRSSVRPHDSDFDGLLDEDAGEDLNEDGYVTQVRRRVGPGQGNYVIDQRDPAGHAMRRVEQGEGDYVLQGEGVDNDRDGTVNEDGIGGLDLHRNYPQNWRVEVPAEETGRGWTQTGAGAYPLSEPETRHVYTWLMSHTNIGVVNSMDTRVPMHLRGPSTCRDDECMFDADRALYEHFDRAGQSFTGYRYAGDVYFDYATRGGGDPNPLFGHGPDFGYFGYGAIWYGDELWNNGEFEDYDDDGDFADWEISRWCAENGRDDCFLPWQEIDHPQLGRVEVGGINPKFWAQNSSTDLLEEWAANQARFNLYLARSLPQVSIQDTRIEEVPAGAQDGATHEVSVTLANAGRIPTALEQAKEIKIVRPDTVELELPEGSGEVVGDAPEVFLGRGESRTVTVRVRVAEGAAPDEVVVRSLSTRGGVDERTVPWALGRR